MIKFIDSDKKVKLILKDEDTGPTVLEDRQGVLPDDYILPDGVKSIEELDEEDKV
jgi:hypothetical protein